jgi:hypothetical protein
MVGEGKPVPLQQLYDEHRELYRLGDELVEAVSAEPVQVGTIIEARRRLSQAVLRHMAHEARIALAPLSASSDPADQAIARRYTGDLLAMRQESSGHIGRWTTRAIEADPAGYLTGTRRLLERMKTRGDWEEREFLPAAARCLARPALRRAG